MSTKHHPSALHEGTNAERLAYATHLLVPGMMWVETDTQDIYVWDGLAWDGALGAGGGAPHNLLSVTHPDTNVAGVVQADIIVGDATPEWARLAKGNAADVLRINAAGADVAWEAEFDAVVPNTIQADDLAATGAAVVAAHRDHEHGFPCGTPVATGTANFEGILYDFVRSDHVHKLHDHLHAGVAGDGGTIPHANLSGLVAPADDHTQYLLASGVRNLAGDLTLDSGVDLFPTDAAGQDLGDATHRFDLFTTEILFGGATGANTITMPDAIADALQVVDGTTGNEYLGFKTAAQLEVVINEDGADIDFRVEGDTEANLLVVDASVDKVGIGCAPTMAYLHVVHYETAAVANYATSFRAYSSAVAGAGPSLMGFYGGANINTGANFRASSVYGGYFEARNRGDIQHTGPFVALYGYAYQRSVGIVDEGKAIDSYYRNRTGTTTVAKGINVYVRQEGGTITTGYGVYIQDVQGSTTFGFYEAGGDTNYFAGKVGVGTNAPTYKFGVFYDNPSYIARFWNDGNNNNRQGVIFQVGLDVNPAAIYALWLDGNGGTNGWVIGNGAGGVSYWSASDERYKNVLGVVDRGLAMKALTEVNPVEFTGKGLDAKTGQKNIGFLAQDMHRFYPEVATYTEEDDLYGIAYGSLTPILWAQNQVLLTRIEALEARLRTN